MSARKAVVIGGASGIGWAIAQTLAADGHTVVIADRNADGAAAHAAGTRRTAHCGRLSKSPTRTRCAACSSRPARWTTVVNCAGFSGFGVITDLPASSSATSSTSA